MINNKQNFEVAYLCINGQMTLGAYHELEKTHSIEWHNGDVFFTSNSNSRPNLEFFQSNMPSEMITIHKNKS